VFYVIESVEIFDSCSHHKTGRAVDDHRMWIVSVKQTTNTKQLTCC